MKETEITVQVFEEKEQILSHLQKQGFKLERTFQLNDWYYIRYDNISGMNYQELLSQSILVRQIIADSEKCQICFKDKVYDKDGNVICEEKIVSLVDNLENTKQILLRAGLNNYCTLMNNSFVFRKGDIYFALQVIEDLGIFIEYEEDETMPQGLTPNEKIDIMLNRVKSLGLPIGENYSCKKVQMYLQKHNK